MSRSYEVIVIGAGHNGLTTAAFLAKHGRKVLVLERREIVGGLAASHEFHPGYRSAGLFHDTRGIRSSIVRALGLERHGLKLRSGAPCVLALGSDGASLLLSGDARGTTDEIARLSPADAGRYEEFRAFLEPYRSLLRAFVEEAPMDLIDIAENGARSLVKRAFRMRRLGRRRMLELLRIPPMCAADWLDEWFENDLLKATLALPAISGGFHGPRSPGTAANLLLWEGSADSGSRDGGPALVSALERAGRSTGVEIRTGEEVAGVCLESGKVTGVETRSGERIGSPVVAASCDPKQVFLRLLDAGRISSRFDHNIRNLRTRGTTAQALLALSSPLRFRCRPDERIELARTGECLDDLERAFDAIKYRRLPENPVLDICLPTTTNPELAPEGGEVVSVLIHFAPYNLEPGWEPQERERLLDRVVEILGRHAPGAPSSVVGRALLSPVDIESTYACSGGQVHHGEHALDQLLVRPVPRCTGYGTPIPGLYLCGSGSHPGGGLTCAPGALAAGAMLGRRVF